MVAAFAAAFMSTIATQLNWGASYLVNDCYRRFVRRDAAESHYVMASRLATALLTVVSAAVAFRIESIGGAWGGVCFTGGGAGAGVLLGRGLGGGKRGGGRAPVITAVVV